MSLALSRAGNPVDPAGPDRRIHGEDGEFQEELAEAVANLDRHYSNLKATARQRLGSLFNAGDYPESLSGAFSIDADFPSVEPPDYLQRLNPQLYEQECQRVSATIR